MKTMKINYYLGFLAVTLGLVLAAGQAKAGFINNPEALPGFVNDGFFEDFERFEDFNGGASLLGVTSLNYETEFLDATGWVGSDGDNDFGVTFMSGPSNATGTQTTQIQWNDKNYILYGSDGAPSKAIVSNYSSRIIEIVFPMSDVDAIGLMVGTYGVPDSFAMKVFGNEGEFSTLSTSISLGSGEFKFFGFVCEESDGITGGIERVLLTGADNDYHWSPIIDNVTFGTTAIPIPGAAWLLGTGLVCLVGFRKTWGKK